MDIKKTYDNINRDKILEQLENMGIQGRMLRFIKGLVRVGGSVLQSKQTDLRSPQEGVLSVTLFLVAINGILGELGNGKSLHVETNELPWNELGVRFLYETKKQLLIHRH